MKLFLTILLSISLCSVCSGQDDVVTGPVTDAIARKLDELEKKREARQEKRFKQLFERLTGDRKTIREVLQSLKEAIEQRKEQKLTDEQIEKVSKGIFDRWRQRMDSLEELRKQREANREKRALDREEKREKRRLAWEERMEKARRAWEAKVEKIQEAREKAREKREEKRERRWIFFKRAFWIIMILSIIGLLIYFSPVIKPIIAGAGHFLSSRFKSKNE